MKSTLSKIATLLFAIILTASVGQTVGAQEDTPQATLKAALEALQINDTRKALVAAHRSMLLLTQQDKFHIRTSKLIASSSNGWGTYTERKNNEYNVGEKIRVYVEPGSFKYKRGAEGSFNFGFTVDFFLTQPDGNILGGQEKFGDFPFESQRPNTEISLNLSINLSGVPTGNYFLKIVVHDKISKESGFVNIPIVIKSS